jgi:thiol-disulfide isomerase/thioredoxin
MWCPPCVRALPEVQKVHEWAAGSDGLVAVYAVNSEEDPDDVRAWVQRRGLTLPVLLDEDGTADEPFQIEGIPTTIVIADGTIRRVFVGLMPNHAEQLRNVVESLLEE